MGDARDLGHEPVFNFLASCRTAGVIFFNPIFGRNSVPAIMKVGLSLAIAMFAVFELGTTQVINYSALEFIAAMLQGFVIGIVIGFIMTLFLSVFQLGGEVMDMHKPEHGLDV